MQPFYILQTIPFLLFALSGVFVLRPRFSEDRLAVRILAYWALSIVVLFSVRIDAVVFLVLGLAAALLTPKSAAGRVAFFLGILFAVPAEFIWIVPFPGINYLLALNHAELLALVLLFPALFADRSGQPAFGRGRATDVLAGIFYVSLALLDLRSTQTLTNSMRNAVELFLLLPLPYYAATRALATREDLQAALRALLVGGLALAGLGTLSALQNWLHYYPLLEGDGFIAWSGAIRGGSVRVPVTLNPTLLGFMMMVTAGLLVMERKNIVQPQIWALGWLLPCALVLEASGSRAAILSVLVAGGAWLFLKIKSGFMRFVYLVAGMAGALTVYLGLVAGGFDAVDAYGTFDYRQRLLDLAAIKFQQAPLFGDADYASDPVFEPLRQGQGIIDFVNGYLQLALGYGSYGVLLFAALLAATWMGVTRSALRAEAATSKSDKRLLGEAALLCMLLASLSVVIMTISFVSYIYLFLLLLLALARVRTGLGSFALRAPAEAEAEPEEEERPAPARRPIASEPEREPVSVSPWPQGYTPGRTGWPS